MRVPRDIMGQFCLGADPNVPMLSQTSLWPLGLDSYPLQTKPEQGRHDGTGHCTPGVGVGCSPGPVRPAPQELPRVGSPGEQPRGWQGTGRRRAQEPARREPAGLPTGTAPGWGRGRGEGSPDPRGLQLRRGRGAPRADAAPEAAAGGFRDLSCRRLSPPPQYRKAPPPIKPPLKPPHPSVLRPRCP